MPRDGVTWLPCAETLFTDEILRVLHTAARLGIRKIRLIGGEPLVYGS